VRDMWRFRSQTRTAGVPAPTVVEIGETSRSIHNHSAYAMIELDKGNRQPENKARSACRRSLAPFQAVMRSALWQARDHVPQETPD